MTASELIKLLARNAARARRMREADELWSSDWLADAIADPDEQTPPWIVDDEGVAHRISGFDSLNLMPVPVCEKWVESYTVIGWADPTPTYCCEECGEMDADELEFQGFMRQRQDGDL